MTNSTEIYRLIVTKTVEKIRKRKIPTHVLSIEVLRAIKGLTEKELNQHIDLLISQGKIKKRDTLNYDAYEIN